MHSVIVTLIRSRPWFVRFRLLVPRLAPVAGLGNVGCYDDTQRKDQSVVSMLDGLSASTMAELSDTLHATVKLEELKAKLRAVC